MSADENLRRALRDLAAASPRGAPPELEVRVKEAYARHHRRRRQQRMAVAVVAACAVISLAWLAGARRHAATIVKEAPRSVQASVAAPKASAPLAKTAPAVTARAAGQKPRTKKAARIYKPLQRPPETVIAATDFVALPSFDPAVPMGPSRIVRVEMPGSDLQLVGFPVNGELLQRQVLTDVLVGQDGVPYAVRLVSSH